jgi:hypothetical protein
VETGSTTNASATMQSGATGGFPEKGKWAGESLGFPRTPSLRRKKSRSKWSFPRLYLWPRNCYFPATETGFGRDRFVPSVGLRKAEQFALPVRFKR